MTASARTVASLPRSLVICAKFLSFLIIFGGEGSLAQSKEGKMVPEASSTPFSTPIDSLPDSDLAFFPRFHREIDAGQLRQSLLIAAGQNNSTLVGETSHFEVIANRLSSGQLSLASTDALWRSKSTVPSHPRRNSSCDSLSRRLPLHHGQTEPGISRTTGEGVRDDVPYWRRSEREGWMVVEGAIKNDLSPSSEDVSRRVGMLASNLALACDGETWTGETMLCCPHHYLLKKISERDNIKLQRKKLLVEQVRNVNESNAKEDESFESAMEDDDESSDWQTSVTESSQASINSLYFQRDGSTLKLLSQRSLLTSGLQNPECSAARLADTSDPTPALKPRTSSPSGLMITKSPQEDECPEMKIRGLDIPHLDGIETAGANTYHIAHSPRTTRQTMLTTELTASPRDNMLQERTNGNKNAQVHGRHDVSKDWHDWPWDWHTSVW